MIVGTCIYDLHLYSTQSLKDKRRVLKSIIDRVKNKFNVSIAEVDQQDNWRHAVLGIAVVSNNTAHVNQVLNTVTKFIENNGEEMEVTHVTMEII
ncbi:MAG: DUF503 domain-containing protein [Bacillota bacterium]|jgi:uncharacterized protein YlxP (DUF503 family)